MRTALTFGTILGLSLFICLVGIHTTGLNADPTKINMTQGIESLLSYVFLTAALLACLRRLQKTASGQSLGYGRALSSGTVLAFTGGIVFGVGQWIYGTFINQGYQATLRAAMIARTSLTPEQLTTVEPQLQFITSPLGSAITQGVPLIFFGVIMSLVVGLFFRKRYFDESSV